LSIAADTANQKIQDSIHDFGYADTGLYENYGKILEAQKINSENLAETYAQLAV
jgi:hypothetical protein